MNSVLLSIEGKTSQIPKTLSSDGERSNSTKEISSSFRKELTTPVDSSTCHDGSSAGPSRSRPETEVKRNLDNRKSKNSSTSESAFAVNQSRGITAASSSNPEARSRIDSQTPANLSALNRSDNKHMNPRKGTYQEVLARAKAAQETHSVIGVIKHKPAVKLRQRENQKKNMVQPYNLKQRSSSKPSERFNKAHSAQENLQMSRRAERNGKKRQRIDLDYKGTMRPPSRSLTDSRSAKSGMESSTSFSSSKKSYRSSLHVDSEHNRIFSSDMEEDSENYSSEASSDMEAAAFDLEEEEQQSLSVAKKEDEAAAAEELELKRKKVERRKMLAQMAATASKKRKL